MVLVGPHSQLPLGSLMLSRFLLEGQQRFKLQVVRFNHQIIEHVYLHQTMGLCGRTVIKKKPSTHGVNITACDRTLFARITFFFIIIITTRLQVVATITNSGVGGNVESKE